MIPEHVKEFQMRAWLKSRTAWLNPRTALPFGARSVGHYQFDSDEKETRPPGGFFQVFWAVSGSGVFVDQNKEYPVKANQTFVYPPDRPHLIYSGPNGFDYWWVTVDGPLAREIFKALRFLEPRTRNSGPAPVHLFEQLVTLIRNANVAADRQASAVAYHLLVSASGAEPAQAEGDEQADDLVGRCLALLENRYTNPSMSIHEIADELGVHRVTLTRRFHARLGMTPIDHLRALRLQRALTLLRGTDLTVAEVAAQTGFADSNYFSRAVRQATGQSPSEMRRG